MAAPVSSSSDVANDGLVLNLINKRLRALRKKLNRISQMEESLAQGKTLNKEQEETFRSKSSVLAVVDELEKLRQPLAQAVGQEIQLALEVKEEKPESTVEEAGTVAKGEDERNDDVPVVSDLLQLIYFGSIFDVRTLTSAHDNMLTRTHERNCCLTYDYVTDDDTAGDPLREWDLDLISSLGGLLISRPANSSLSHKNALQKCLEHAKLWLANSKQPIEPNSTITYAGLREKLDKIMASEYFTTTPEIKAPVEVAAAGASYTSFPVYGSVDTSSNLNVPLEGSVAEYQQQEEVSPNSHGSLINNDEPVSVEQLQQQGGSDVENKSEQAAKTELGTEVDQNSRDIDDSKDQQSSTRRSYQNYRGGRGDGGSGGRRSNYSNGRGGRGGNRGGGGGYQNGRGQFSDQQGGYYPRNQNYRGRGGRGMGGNYSYREPAEHAGHAQAAS